MNDIKRPIIKSYSVPQGAKRNSLLQKNVTGRSLPPPPKNKRKPIKIILSLIVLIIVILGGFIVARASNLTSKIFVGENSSFYKKVTDLISSQVGGTKLIGEKDGQINVLLLGIGGPGHDGPYLSDTIILAQIRPEEHRAALVSIPRDYLVDLGKNDFRKINAAFAEGYARTNNWNDAGKLARQVVENMSGLEIPYFAVADFQGFQKTVDLVGGVDVAIDETFTDYTFPNDATQGYLAPVTFKQGEEHMDGKRALIFARSRHAAGSEGSDFARSLRQQKIINAAKSKLIELNLITDAGKVNELLSIVSDHVHTNLSPGEMLRLYSIGKDYNDGAITSMSLTPQTGLICDEILESNGAYVLSPCPGKSKQDIQTFFKNSFTTGKLSAEQSVVWLADSTTGGKLYAPAAKKLEEAGLTVYKISFASQPLAQNVVYKVNDKPAALEYIKNNLDASEVTLPPPGVKVSKDKVDLIVILGE